MDRGKEIDDLLDLTDTSDLDSTSSSSNEGVFEAHIPFVLELHDIRKDEPSPATENGAPTTEKIKKIKKKKKGVPAIENSHSTISSDSMSDSSSVAPSSTDVKEEFYDAHESFHIISGNPPPVAAVGRLQVHSETSHNPKTITSQLTTASDLHTITVTRREPPIIKPTSPPE